MTREDKIASDIIFDELAAKHKDGYLFRGEPDKYDEVTSSLYRDAEWPREVLPRLFEIESDIVLACLYHCYGVYEIQAKIQEKSYKSLQEQALKKLSEIQHFGGATNLIDFTTCYLRGLFFACDKWPERDGRIIVIHPDSVPVEDHENQDDLIPWGEHDYIRRTNGFPKARVEAQKSVFIHAKSGKLNADLYDVISVPSRLKTEIREWLSVEKRINRRSIYPDTIGFVDNNRQTRSLEFMFAAEQQLAKRNYKCVIENCGKSTNEQAHSYVYHIWGLAHLQRGETSEAIDKFERALTIDDWRDKAHGNRDSTNGASLATRTAKNIAEGKRGEHPTLYAIFSLNHNLGEGRPLPRGSGMFSLPHPLYTLPPDTLLYQVKRWHVLNLFYDYNTLWDALPQLPEDDLRRSREYQEHLKAGRIVGRTLAGEKIEPNHGSNVGYYDSTMGYDWDPQYDPEFYRKLRSDEIENPLKS